ncbi:alpha/beta hydrolase [Rothia sp. P5766]|uniref:alpha/beta hydrolase n=1 Tax=Rothia sp. P5766 TaxID=3402656 RepID=UPI003AE3C909
MMGSRPSDWSPLTGGDPCPGDPDSWQATINHWSTRKTEIDAIRKVLNRGRCIDGRSNRITKIEHTFELGATMCEKISGEFQRVHDVLTDWQKNLREMQEKADAALSVARQAQIHKEETQDKLRFYERHSLTSALGRLSADLSGSMIFSLRQDISEANACIATQQAVVDEIREQYTSRSATAVNGYNISGIGGIFVDRSSGASGLAPFSSADEVLSFFLGFDAQALTLAFETAAASDEFQPQLLDALSKLTPQQINEYFAAHPEFARFPLQMQGSNIDRAEAYKAWWAQLDENQQKAFTIAAPGIVGNMDGVPYTVRDQANRKLAKTVAEDPNTDEATRKALENLLAAATMKDDGIPRYVTSLDLSNIKPENEDGYDYNNVLASVSLGSVDDADKVTVVVPGMTNNVAGSIEDLVGTGDNIYKEQYRAEQLHGTNDPKLAVVLWIGYETPPHLDEEGRQLLGGKTFTQSKMVTDIYLAEQGGQNLAGFIDGLNVTKSTAVTCERDGLYSDAHISVIAHSYGTTTTAEAMQVSETKVDNIVMYGSAGLGIESIYDANSAEGWNVERDAKGRQKIFFTDSMEDWTALGGYLPGWLLDSSLISKENRLLPYAVADAQRFQSTEGISADGYYLEDVDMHGFNIDGDNQGYAHKQTSSLVYGARAALGYTEDLDLKLYKPYYYESEGDSLRLVPVTAADCDENGRVRPEIMQKVRKAQSSMTGDQVLTFAPPLSRAPTRG